MAKKEFNYRGKNIEDLKKLSLKEFAELLPARQRRSVLRGNSDQQKAFVKKIREGKSPKTHCRDMIITPEMVGKIVKVYSGKEFVIIKLEEEMLGHRLGEFVLTRKRVTHNSPGVGATKSSSNVSVK